MGLNPKRNNFTTPMYAPPGGVTSVSIGGVEVFPDDDGFIEVPNASIQEMLCHGLLLNKPGEETSEVVTTGKSKLKFGSKKK